MREAIAEGDLVTRIDLALLAARADLALGRRVPAAGLLVGLDEKIAELAGMTAFGRTLVPFKRAELLGVRAELALAEERRPDAVALWRQAAAQLPGGSPERSEYEQRALELWRELGGSEESFALLAAGDELPAPAETMSIWEEVDRELEPFELIDLDGRTWTLEDLAGETVLINVWATWCAPCRVELPYLVRLQESFEEGQRLRVLTFNVDQNPGLIVPYLEKEGLELDVLLAERYIERLMGGYSIPISWILDADGRVRREQTGFSAEAGELWIEEARRTMEEVRDGAAQ